MIRGVSCAAMLLLMSSGHGRAEDYVPSNIGCPSGWVKRGGFTGWRCPDSGPMEPMYPKGASATAPARAAVKPREDLASATRDLQIAAERVHNSAVAGGNRIDMADKIRRLESELARVKKALQ